MDAADTTTTITDVSPGSTVVGQSYDVSWTTTVNGPGAGTPSGTVTVVGWCRQLLGAGGGGHVLADVDVGGGEDVDGDVLG